MQDISVCCATWNVNGKIPPSNLNLLEWLCAGHSSVDQRNFFSPSTPLNPSANPSTSFELKDEDILSVPSPKHLPKQTADIYVISLQEMVGLNVMNVVLNSSASEDASKKWQERLASTLEGTNQNYSLIFSKYLIGLQIFVFAKDSITPLISDVRSSVVYTGWNGVTGNKGGIGLRFQIMDSSVCFICAHFHANRENLAARNADYFSILDNSIFVPTVTLSSSKQDKLFKNLRKYKRPTLIPNNEATNNNNNNNSNNSSETDQTKSVTRIPSEDFSVFSQSYLQKKTNKVFNILDHDVIFWMGDLNYRIEVSIDDAEINSKVIKGEWQDLADKYDQLTNLRKANDIFLHFNEKTINFPPTYKLEPGKFCFDRRPDKKLRAPAWCDRVLYREKYKDSIRCDSYDSHPLPLSDHWPVTCWSTVQCRVIDPVRAYSTHQELLFSVDKYFNASTPKIDIDEKFIDFGITQCDKSFTKYITITNTGTSLAKWLFTPPPGSTTLCQPWLHISPLEGILAPGESTQVSINCHISSHKISSESSEDDSAFKFEDIIIIRVVRGSDFFVICNSQLDAESTSLLKKRTSYVLQKKNSINLSETNKPKDPPKPKEKSSKFSSVTRLFGDKTSRNSISSPQKEATVSSPSRFSLRLSSFISPPQSEYDPSILGKGPIPPPPIPSQSPDDDSDEEDDDPYFAFDQVY